MLSGMMRRILLVLFFGSAVALLGLMVLLRLRYGGGLPYPDLSGKPLLSESRLQVAATFDEPIGNVAVSDDGRLFFTVHPESRPTTHRLLEWRDGEARPYPSAAAQRRLFSTVLGVVIDRRGRLWTIDHGNHGFGKARLLAFDLATGKLLHNHVFPRDIAPRGSFLQDLQVDPSGENVYIADASIWRKSPAIVVYDVSTGAARRVLERHQSVVAQDWVIVTPAKRMVFFGGLAALKPGIDGIAIDPAGEWVYYGAMCHDGLFRVRAADLDDRLLDPRELAKRVERFSSKPLSDGLSTDFSDNVYITDVEHGAVMRVGPDRALKTLIRSSRIRWADALSFGPGGWLYLADSAIPDQVLRSKEHIRSSGPYHVYRFLAGAAGVPGQ